MASQALYDGRISGGLIVSALNSAGVTSGSNLVVIPSSNGQRVVILRAGG